MKVSEIMTSDFEMIDSTSSLTAAAQKMKSLNVGFLPVQEGTRLIGLITDRILGGNWRMSNPDSRGRDIMA
jgi:CBS domain-containing protein